MSASPLTLTGARGRRWSGSSERKKREHMKILAFESSCDETAVAVVEDGRTVLSDAIAGSGA